MLLHAALVLALAGPAAPPASHEDLIAEAIRQQEADNFLEAADLFFRAFEAMPADVKRQDIGEEVAATLHFEAQFVAFRAVGDVAHLERAKRILEILLAEQRAAVTAGARTEVSLDVEQKLRLVTEKIDNERGVPPPVVIADPKPDPPPVQPIVLRPESPNLTLPIALLSVGSLLGVGGLACVISGEAYRAHNKNRFEKLSEAEQADRPDFLDTINGTATGVTVAGAVALVGGVAMVVPGAIIYKRRTADVTASLTPLRIAAGGGAMLRIDF